MKIAKNEITGYLAINVTESETAWNALSLYNYGDEVRDGHYIYTYAGVDGTNTVSSPSVEALAWVETRPTNYYSMLDGNSTSQTTRTSPLIFDVEMHNYDVATLMNIEASDVLFELILIATDEVIYSESFNTNDTSAIVDFYTYCFNEFDLTNYVYNPNLPLAGGDTKLRITVTKDGGGDVKVGRLCIGKSFYIGEVAYGVNLGLESYSVKTTDEFGNDTLVQRGAVELNSYDIRCATSKIPPLRRKAIELDAIPILFIGDETVGSNLEQLLTYGYWQNFSLVATNPTYSNISLTVKGVL